MQAWMAGAMQANSLLLYLTFRISCGLLHFVPAILQSFAIRPIGLLAHFFALAYIATVIHAGMDGCGDIGQQLILIVYYLLQKN